jgi:hypothetical protein
MRSLRPSRCGGRWVGSALPDEALGDEGLRAVLQGEEREAERHLALARGWRCRHPAGRGAHLASANPPPCSLASDPSLRNAPRPRCSAFPFFLNCVFPFLDRARFAPLSPLPCFWKAGGGKGACLPVKSRFFLAFWLVFFLKNRLFLFF